MREAHLIPRRSGPPSASAAPTSVTWRSRSPSRTRRRSRSRGRSRPSSTCCRTPSCWSTTATTRSGRQGSADCPQCVVDDHSPLRLRVCRLMYACTNGTAATTRRPSRSAVSMAHFASALATPRPRRRGRHFRLDEHDGVRVPLVSERGNLPVHLGFETALFRVVADDELSGGPDANAGDDGVGRSVARRE